MPPASDGGFDALSGAPGGAVAHPPPGIRTVPVQSPHATRLVLIRHGEAQCNVSGVCGGPKGCTGLTELGISQVEALRLRLGTTGELAGAAALYASVLPRAIQTAELLAPVLRSVGAGGSMGPVPEVQVECGLCELHPGQADGLTWGEFSDRFGDPDWDRHPERPIAPDGESWAGFVRRAADALEVVVQRHVGGLVVAACHAGVVEASLLALLPVDGGRSGARLRLRTLHASMTTWERDADQWRLLGYNDATHLVGAGGAGGQQA
jgi:probable phosphoglycerate mutase